MIMMTTTGVHIFFCFNIDIELQINKKSDKPFTKTISIVSSDKNQFSKNEQI